MSKPEPPNPPPIPGATSVAEIPISPVHEPCPSEFPRDGEQESPSQGPSLTLLYSLIAFALAVAIGFALLIVAPFYHRR